MRYSFVADVHAWNHRKFGGPVDAGLNRRAKACVAALAEACRSLGASDTLVVLGDLFDGVRPEPQLITKVRNALQDRRTCILLGNHDMVSTAFGDHALGPLGPEGVLDSERSVIAEPSIRQDLWLIPYRPGDAREWLPSAMAECALLTKEHGSHTNTLALHLGIVTKDTPPWLRDAPDAIPIEQLVELCKGHGIKAVFSGNWHTHWVEQYDEVHVCQVGALVPTGFDNPGLNGYGYVVHYNTELSNMHAFSRSQVRGPRFVKQAWSDAQRHDWHHEYLYLQVVAKAADIATANEWLRENKEDGHIADGEVVLDDAESRASARTAATVARSADTMAEALDAYVAEMPLDEGVSREAVLETCRGYLR